MPSPYAPVTPPIYPPTPPALPTCSSCGYSHEANIGWTGGETVTYPVTTWEDCCTQCKVLSALESPPAEHPGGCGGWVWNADHHCYQKYVTEGHYFPTQNEVYDLAGTRNDVAPDGTEDSWLSGSAGVIDMLCNASGLGPDFAQR